MNEQQRQLRRAAAEEFMQSLDQLETLLNEEAIAEAATLAEETHSNQASDPPRSSRFDVGPRPGQPPQSR